MKRIWKHIGILFLGFWLAGPLAAESLTDTFSGLWEGNGVLTTAANRPQRRTRCQVEVVPEARSEALHIAGVCAVAVRRSRFVLRITWLKGGRVVAGFRARGMEETVQYRGKQSGKTIELLSSTTQDFDGSAHLSRLVIAFTGKDSFAVDEWRQPEGHGADLHNLSLVFKKKDL